jgi:hypothetical protein
MEVTRDWTKLCKFHNLHSTKYYYDHYSKKDETGGLCGTCKRIREDGDGRILQKFI